MAVLSGTKVAQKYCVLRKIQFLRKFVDSFGKHNKTDIFRLSDKAADGFFPISLFEKISQAFPGSNRVDACTDLDYAAIARMVHQT